MPEGFWNKRDIALGAAIGTLILFGAMIILMMTQAQYDLKISGQLDGNTVWVTFLGIVLAMINYLGIKAAMNSRNGGGTTPPPATP